ncbi:hypothetical protein J6590_079451 [Homalodisca vitripennis]|nr:hypothetical protein J6590_079451 [Homalodisca vitripennis]
MKVLSRSIRNQWLSAAKKRRLQTTDLASPLSPAPVYINEHLTTNNKLLGYSKSAARCVVQGWQDRCAEV